MKRRFREKLGQNNCFGNVIINVVCQMEGPQGRETQSKSFLWMGSFVIPKFIPLLFFLGGGGGDFLETFSGT